MHITKSKHLIILGSVYSRHVHLYGHNTCVSHITTMSESKVEVKKSLLVLLKKKKKKASSLAWTLLNPDYFVEIKASSLLAGFRPYALFTEEGQ